VGNRQFFARRLPAGVRASGEKTNLGRGRPTSNTAKSLAMDTREGQTMLIGILLVLLVTTTNSNAKRDAASLTTVPHVDLDRYLGEWREIARYPNRFQRECDRSVTADYAIRADGKISVENSCVTRAGKTKRITGSATLVDKTTNAKLHVTFFWPFYGSYWVIDLDPEYKWAVVGEPSGKYLWILSRSPELDSATYTVIIGHVKTKGYDPARPIRSRDHRK
jgi:apolipoprotein D and lipocalin family protein